MNLADVVRMRSNINNPVHIADEMSTFLKQINKKLSLVELELEDFKREEKYNFSRKTATLLIKLHDLRLGHNISKFEKNNIELADRSIMEEYLNLVTELCVSHFEEELMKQIEQKLLAIRLDLDIYEKDSLKKISENLFKDSGMNIDVKIVDAIEKLFVDIYSTNKYPHLSELDRVSLFTELESQLAMVIEEHQAAIDKVNYYRTCPNCYDKDINEILEY